MRVFIAAGVCSTRLTGALRALLVATLVTTPAFAQTQPKPPAAPAAPAQPRPAAPAAAPRPAAAQPQAAQPVMAFPEGAKVAFIDVQRIIAESAEGKSATLKVKLLNDKKVAELNEKNKALQADQQKLQSAALLSPSAQEDLQKRIERQDKDIQRTTEDAQKELQDLQQTLQADFQRKLSPAIQDVAVDRGIQMVFAVGDAGLAWAYPGLDITPDVIKRFDAQVKK